MIVLFDRVIDSTQIFTNLSNPHLTQEQYSDLKLKYEKIVTKTPVWCKQNIGIRGCKEEQVISHEYLEELHFLHEEYYQACKADLIKNQINF